jgi:hypothetical protein
MLRITARNVADCHHRVAECREKGRRYEQPVDREFFAGFLRAATSSRTGLTQCRMSLTGAQKSPANYKVHSLAPSFGAGPSE